MKRFARACAVSLCTTLWIAAPAFGWGDLGHRIVAEYGSQLADPKALANCHVTSAQLVEHTNDPDKLWREQRFTYPREAEMHFFHVDRQPRTWRQLNAATDTSQGRLVYHILDYADEARRFRKEKKWDKLALRLYGLSHYLGDLTQPLHLNHDYDGVEAGLPGLHAQFETKMLNRFEDGARAGVKKLLATEKIPELWSQFDLRHLVFDTAEQSNFKVARLFKGASLALLVPKHSRRRKSAAPPQPRFEKPSLWKETGPLAIEQLALAARLWAWTLNDVCR